ncbi:hypothetical protein [Zoogloea sp.]|jgi:hypothetical protein|uniref:hypothetical protein n=1 Tax=Zoogloea sp. TaxID=49181 RepID=UPI0037DA3923
MNIQPVSATYFAHAMERASSLRHVSPAAAAESADPVHISSAARAALAAEGDASVEAKLASIRARGPINRSEADQAYLFTHDKRLAEIATQGKPPEKLTADELDYMQKATGLVNTMANLSSAEKALYDKAVASGNTAAAAGISQIALVRMMGHTAGGAGGATYDPLNTAITAANVERYFSHSIVDPSGQAKAGFQALIAFLNADRVG